MNKNYLHKQIDKKRRHLTDIILKKNSSLSDKDIVKISAELDELIALYIIQMEDDSWDDNQGRYMCNPESI